MSYFELLQENPALFVLALLISLIVTLIVYGAFPIIFAKMRKTPITRKKYRYLCFGINIVGIIFFFLWNDNASVGPYVLWTWIFSNYGVKILEAKGLLSDVATTEEENIEVVNNKICFCRKCGTRLEADSRFCRKCGTEIKEEQQ